MGLFNRMKDPATGTANVVSVGPLDPGATGKRSCSMELIVQGDGLTPTAVAFEDKVPVIRWPKAGDVLPVTVDRSNPEHLEIDWDELPIRGLSTAVTPMVATPVSPGATPAPASDGSAHSIRDEHPEIPPEAAEVVDKITSMFPGAQVNVGEPTVIRMDGGSANVAEMLGAAAGGDRISQLERLARLHEEGALSDDEFEAEKKRVLEES